MAGIDDYDAGAALTAYYPSKTERRPARLWATEHMIQTLAECGIIEVFYGAGTDPTVLTDYASTKLWLQTSAGLTDAPGTIRAYDGSGDASDIANWPALTVSGFQTYLSLAALPLALSNGGTGVNLSDPNDDRVLFWDDSVGAMTWLDMGPGVTIYGTTLGHKFDPRTYGAVGDGTTDDRAAFVLAAAAAASAGDKLYLSAGTYAIASNLTISVDVVFAGGIIKPGSGVTVTLSGTIDAGAEQVFDISGSGTIAGSGEIIGGAVWAEWWGAVGNGSTDCQSYVAAAIAFLKQRTLAGVLGGRLRFGIGKFVMGSGVTIDFSGCRIEGTGEHTTRITHNFNGDLFTVNGTVAGGEAAYGFELRDIGIDHSTATPTAGSTIKLTRVKDFTIDNVTIVNHFLAIHLIGCEGTEVSSITNCHIISPSSGTVQTGSACIKLEGNASGATTGLNETIMITNTRGGGTKTQYGVWMQAADVVTFTGCHFWGADTTTYFIDGNDSYSIYNVRSVGCIWEGISGAADYACYIDSGTQDIDAIQFVGDEFLNGATAMVACAGAAAQGITWEGCVFKQATADAMILSRGKSLIVNGCQFIDANVGNSGTISYVQIGDGSGAPTDVVVTNNIMGEKDFSNTVDKGIWIRDAAGRYVVKGNIINDVTSTIVDAEQELTIASGAVTIKCLHHTIDTEADASTDDLDTINGGYEGDILTISAVNSARSVVAKDGTGNLVLAGDFTMDNAEDTLTLIKIGSNWHQLASSNNGA